MTGIEEQRPGTHHHPRRRRGAVVIAVAGLLALTGCSDTSSDGPASGPTIRITSQDTTENRVLSEVYAQYLRGQGFRVDVEPSTGTRTQVFGALQHGSADLEIDYTGGALAELKPGQANGNADETADDLSTALGAVGLDSADRGNAYDAPALVALTSWADEHGVTAVSDLGELGTTVTLGADRSCARRPDCLPGYNGTPYGLHLAFVPVAAGAPLMTALRTGRIQVAQYRSTAPEVAEGEIVALKDDKGLQAAQNLVPIFRQAVSSDELKAALDQLTGEITNADLAAWNKSVDVNKEAPADVARQWLDNKNLN